MGIFESLKKLFSAEKEKLQTTTAPEVPQVAPEIKKPQTHRVTGVKYYEKNLLQVSNEENPYYSLTKKDLIKNDLIDQPIYQYTFRPQKVELVPEPTNEQDPNAVKVVIDGVHVGYIKAGSCKRILNLLNENRIDKIDCKISGGNYKCVYVSGMEDERIIESELEKGKSDYKIELSIHEQ